MPTLRITSRRDGFRRCGVAHPAAPTVHEDGAFTPEQIERLQAEPMLLVEILPDEPEAKPEKPAKPKPNA